VIGKHVIDGLIAGAAGTAALDATTYADMALRARGASDLPQKMVREFAKMAGDAQLSKPPEELSEEQQHRRNGLGGLIGYADGFGAGALYGLVRPAVRDVSWFWMGLGLAALTMLLSEGTATALKQTDPRKWGVSGWIADIVPRVVYGWVTALTFDQLEAGENR
jgi:hypothetical protein